MNKTKLSWLIVCILYLNTPNAFSDPSKTFSYLMNNPTSMLDFGLYKLEKDLNILRTINPNDLVQDVHNNGQRITVDYSWEKNKLNLNYIFYLKNDVLKKKSGIDYCKLATNEIRGFFGARYKGDFARELREIGSISKYFKHAGYSNKNSPDNFMDEIENSTIIAIQIRSNPKNKIPFLEVITECESPLLESETYIKQ
jgi:hypothetical protein